MVADARVIALRGEGTDLKVPETCRAPVSLLPTVCLAPVLDESTLGATTGTLKMTKQIKHKA